MNAWSSWQKVSTAPKNHGHFSTEVSEPPSFWNLWRLGGDNITPGWRWSLHVGKQTGKSSTAHIGYVVSGHMAVRGADGAEITVGPEEVFEVGPGHDAWVVGDEPCVALDFEHLDSGTADYK
jgi:hypothetical protein